VRIIWRRRRSLCTPIATVAVRIAIVLNPRSGNSPERTNLEHALRQAALAADIHAIPDAPDVAAWMIAIARWYDVVVAAGGDGTVSSAAEAVISEGKALGVIPAGTRNHFARDAGIPNDLDAAIALIAAGHVRALDVGDVNGLLFINNASVGAYPRLLWERDRVRDRGVPKPLAHTLAVVRTWLQLRTFTVRLCMNRRELIRRTPFVLVGNSEYEVEGMQFGRRRTMTDGCLSLYIASDIGRLGSLALPARALLRKLKQHDNFEIYRAPSASMELARQRISIALDGEIRTLDTPLRFSVCRQVLRTIVPASEDA
jgi:diacylglycerol kinase family enzyme